MLKLTPHRNRRAPIAWATLGALLLAASMFAGTSQFMPTARQQASAQDTALATDRAVGLPAEPEPTSSVREAAGTQTRKFRVNLFLFRH